MSNIKKVVRHIWRETTAADPNRAAVLPVQTGPTSCADCWARPGETHQLSCEQVTPEQFRAFLAGGAR